MFPLVDLIVTLGGLIVPPAFDFIKKKFIKGEEDTPERTIGTLATTKPDALGPYIDALASYTKAKVDFFNRDVVGEIDRWVSNLRASIRPIGVIFSFVVLSGMAIMILLKQVDIDNATLTGIRLSCELVISSWFGTRISLRG